MSAFNAFVATARADLQKAVRVPSFIVPTVVFPILFFSMFGLPNTGRSMNGVNVGPHILASYGAYAMMAVALTSFAVSISTERGLGWSRLLRVTPLSPVSYLAAKIVTAFAIGLVALTALFVFGATVGHVSLPLAKWVSLEFVLLVGMLPFVLLGLAIGYVAGPTAAAPIANLIFLPLSFASGLFIPIQFLPDAVKKIAPYLPAYHLGQLGWTTIGEGDPNGIMPHVIWMLGYGVVFGALAIVAFKRDEGREFS